ncbi:hypothetical protein A2U01_0101087, partial [Trifolium medium]|nr:hypothetical protein [Trifolium medium]
MNSSILILTNCSDMLLLFGNNRRNGIDNRGDNFSFCFELRHLELVVVVLCYN